MNTHFDLDKEYNRLTAEAYRRDHPGYQTPEEKNAYRELASRIFG